GEPQRGLRCQTAGRGERGSTGAKRPRVPARGGAPILPRPARPRIPAVREAFSALLIKECGALTVGNSVASHSSPRQVPREVTGSRSQHEAQPFRSPKL